MNAPIGHQNPLLALVLNKYLRCSEALVDRHSNVARVISKSRSKFKLSKPDISRYVER